MMTEMMIICGILLGPAFSDWIPSAMYLCSVVEAEELSEEDMERFSHFASNPLDLNSASLQRLKESGLLRDFQASSLVEYRNLTGNVGSFVELALVPGFDERMAAALSFFTTLSSSRDGSLSLDGKLSVQGSSRKDEDSAPEHKYKIRYETSLGDAADFRWTSGTAYESRSFGPGTISGAYRFKVVPLKVVAGHFNARFGQGLCSWSGTALNYFGTAEALRKNGTGITHTGSAGATLCGVGAEFASGNWTFSTAVSFKGGINFFPRISYDGKRLSLGLNGNLGKESQTISADWRCSLGGIGFYGEVALRRLPFEGCFPAALCGLFWEQNYPVKLSVLGKWYHPLFKREWSGITAVFQTSSLALAADVGFREGKRQYRILSSYGWNFSRGAWRICPKLRISSRYRPADSPSWRTDLRADLPFSVGNWEVNFRGNLLWSSGRSFLWYAETGHGGDVLSLYSRFTLFDVQNWDDRIYVYERDVPGNFNVHAYYGRGWAASLCCSLKPEFPGRFSHRFYLRASYVAYPWNLSSKPPRLETRIQYVFLF